MAEETSMCVMICVDSELVQRGTEPRVPPRFMFHLRKSKNQAYAGAKLLDPRRTTPVMVGILDGGCC